MSDQSVQVVEQYVDSKPLNPSPTTQQPVAGQQTPFVTGRSNVSLIESEKIEPSTVVNSVPSYPTPSPITQQPLAGQQAPIRTDGWMGLPLQQFSLQGLPLQALYRIPDEMHYLSTVDHLLIMQEIELWEIFIGWETNNKYTIKNDRGETVYYAVEESSWLARCCCGATRPFTMRILDVYKNEVIHFKRPLGCGYVTGSCCCCCLQKLEAYTKNDEFIGTVQEKCSVMGPKYDINNENGDTVLNMQGPICIKFRPSSDFNVFSVDDQVKVGKIAKQWSGFGRELFTDADIFGLSFPVDLDVRIKAVLLGACFLIDFMFYESSPQKKK